MNQSLLLQLDTIELTAILSEDYIFELSRNTINKKPLLHFAVEKCNNQMLKLFLDKGVDIEEVCENRETALFYACKEETKKN